MVKKISQMRNNPAIRTRDRMTATLGEVFLWGLWMLRFFCKYSVLRAWYYSLVTKLIKQTKLFDVEWYLEVNNDVEQSARYSIRHYARFGDKEGRWPMPLFDPVYYRSRVISRTKYVNSLLHYAWVGRYLRASPSPWFDVQYYLSNNKDVARTRSEPLFHYLNWGGLEGRSPNPQFDGVFYLRSYPEVRASRLNPLIHYLKYGRHVGLAIRHSNDLIAHHNTFVPLRVDGRLSSAWDELIPVKEGSAKTIDVIIPVYKDMELTLRCIYSVLTAKDNSPFELVVINDASPESALVADLEYLSRRGLITLLCNVNNKGFVHTVNRGISLHTERDVVLLNSDTEVYGDWLVRLNHVAHKQHKAATVTPLSNNATICSYPRFLNDNPYPLETSYEELDRMAAQVNCENEVETPTGVGFCMYIRRDAIDDIGPFDESAFGKGYGEENDFCQRAIYKGWRNIVAPNVFVRHYGGASFQGEKLKRVAVAMKVMAQRHPGYHDAIKEFLSEDPLAEARYRLDWARLRGMVCEENVLIVCHSRGGGAERHVQEDTERFLDEGKGVFYLRPERGKPDYVRIGNPACRQLLNLHPFELSNLESLSEALTDLKITLVHTHGLVDFAPNAPEYIQNLVHDLDVSLHIDIHDYKVICPRINLADQNGRYCGEPRNNECERCLFELGSPFGVVDIADWRSMHERILMAADNVLVPDVDVYERLGKYFKNVKFEISPHENIESKAIQIQLAQLPRTQRLRVVIVGAISKIKGFDVLLACARNAKKRGLLLDFIVMGYTFNDRLLEKSGVTVTGRYLEQDAEDILKNLEPDAVWLPSIWPETYSYTLSLSLRVNRPVFAFSLGAIGRRITELGMSEFLMPLSEVDDVAKINERFMMYRNKCVANTETKE